MGKFSDQVARFRSDTRENIDRKVRGTTLGLFRGIILGSPVDQGRFKGNWQTSAGVPITTSIDRIDPSGSAALSDVVSNMSGAGGLSWMTNNLPYAEVLEFGGYPNPPKRGTRIPGKKKASLGLGAFSANIGLRQAMAVKANLREPGTYEIRSIGGYSKQAPAGMVRINMARIADILAAANV